MKRLISLLSVAVLLTGAVAYAQVPRTVICEMASATW